MERKRKANTPVSVHEIKSEDRPLSHVHLGVGVLSLKWVAYSCGYTAVGAMKDKHLLIDDHQVGSFELCVLYSGVACMSTGC